MKKKTKILFGLLLLSISVTSMSAKEIHVAKTGDDGNTGDSGSPYLSISKAAEVAAAGDVIIIHEGTYREYVNPISGGSSDSDRITFKSADGEEVFVKGSEPIDTWIDQGDSTWEISLPSSYFDGYNPYTLFVNGDYQNYGQWHHRGDVYINNAVLSELQTLEQVKTESYTWYTVTVGEETSIYANFGSEDPNSELSEINVRELIFFATDHTVDFITIDRLRFLHAAPNWQAPNEGSSDSNRLDQVGAVGCLMGKGWIIENCEVSLSKTAGIMMGESAGNQDDHWDIEGYGDHIIRNNLITKCGEYGIAGQKGITRSTIEGNRIEDINYRNEFGGHEPAGIKIWNSVDVHIENNLIREISSTLSSISQCYCIWIDFANQGTRITRNVLIGGPKTTTALFLEANFGPTLVDNNIIIDRTDRAIQVYSGGSIFAHNLFINSNFHYAIQEFGNGGSGARNAMTFLPHSMTVSNGSEKVEIVHNKMYNNIFAGGNGPINFSSNSGSGNVVDHNLYIDGTAPAEAHTNATSSSFNFSHSITDTENGIDLSFEMDNSFSDMTTSYIDGSLVGIIPLVDQTIEDELGNEIRVNGDFNQVSRTGTNPIAGPLENLLEGSNTISIGTAMQPTPGIKHPVPVSIPPVVVQGPYLGTPSSIPGIIEAENYDLGGQGVAYNDDNQKEGDGSIRPDDMVDLGGGNGGVAVAWFFSGEWLEYTSDIESGVYTIEIDAAGTSPGQLDFRVNNTNVGNIAFTSTGDWNNYQRFSVSNVTLPEATDAILKISTTGGFNLDKMTFIRDRDVSVDEQFSNNMNYSFYPNPVKNTIYIRSGQESSIVKIYNIDLRLLQTEHANSVDVTHLSDGVYLISIDNQGYLKFIKI
jgi:hypothetical protein